MNAITDVGSAICGSWQAGNDHLAYYVGANPDAIAVSEAVGAFSLAAARAFKRVGNRGFALPIVVAAGFAQTSVNLQQLACGNPSTAKAADSQFRAFNQYQISVPERAFNTGFSGATKSWDFVCSTASSAWNRVWGTSEKPVDSKPLAMPTSSEGSGTPAPGIVQE